MSGFGDNLNELKMRILQIQDEISKLGPPAQVLPEMMSATNALRLNEYLIKSDAQKTALNDAYGQYARQLEGVISTLLSIQADLRDIIKTEAAIIDGQESEEKTEKKTPAKKSKK